MQILDSKTQVEFPFYLSLDVDNDSVPSEELHKQYYEIRKWCSKNMIENKDYKWSNDVLLYSTSKNGNRYTELFPYCLFVANESDALSIMLSFPLKRVCRSQSDPCWVLCGSTVIQYNADSSRIFVDMVDNSVKWDMGSIQWVKDNITQTDYEWLYTDSGFLYGILFYNNDDYLLYKLIYGSNNYLKTYRYF